MFLPLHDGVPLAYLKAPVVTRALIGACVTAYLATMFGILPIGQTWFIAGLGLIPAVLFGTEALPEGLPLVPGPLTVITSLFLHGSFFHLAGNMLFLWVFGDNVEDALGHWRFLVFYICCGIAAGLTHAFVYPESQRPLIGASGAVAGVVAAYLILYPRVRIWGLFFGRIPLKVPAIWAIGLWIAAQVVAAFMGGNDAVGWFAHLGGLIAGGLLIVLMRRKIEDPIAARVTAKELRATSETV